MEMIFVIDGKNYIVVADDPIVGLQLAQEQAARG